MHERLKDILAEAIARSRDPDERRRIVRECCGDDTELLEAALSLIAYAPVTGDRPSPDEDDRPLDSDGTIVLDGGPSTPGPLGPHVRLGPYRLIDVLGHGASGVVWRARQESFDRDVAIKVLERGGGQEIFLTRFRREQQILASLSHPGIAQVHDAGTTPQGFPFYVMELLEGSDVSTHCDERRLDVRARLSLVIRICRAVQHAHQRGVIHRDLKPSNVLCIVDDEGISRPKVIDFGIARSESSIGDVTEQGVVLGTLLYMSPEQIQTSHDVDVTTDVYSLGVVAYELLVGERPGERLIDHEKGLLENLRILEREPTPSLLSRLDPHDDDVLERAQARNTTPEALRDELRGEPEWIVQMATAKDRRERYGSVEEFARDLERHLDGRVVRAAPPGVGYRARKFVRRHRAPIAAFTAIFVALLGGLIVSTWSYLQAESARAVIAERLTTSRLLAAEASLQAADVRSARTALAAVDPDGRGWLWSLLSRMTDASRYQRGWSASPRAIRVDASGGILVATSAGDVHAWNPGTEDVEPPLVSTGGNVQHVGFLDITGRIVFTTDTNEVFVRSAAPPTVERIGRAPVTVVAVEPAPDGGGVLVASIDGRVVEFPTDGQAPRTLFDPGPIREWCKAPRSSPSASMPRRPAWPSTPRPGVWPSGGATG
jgi:serine/threonine protein kinase